MLKLDNQYIVAGRKGVNLPYCARMKNAMKRMGVVYLVNGKPKPFKDKVPLKY